MLWIFVIIGSLTLVSVLLRSIEVVSRKRPQDGSDSSGPTARQTSALDHPVVLICQFVLLGAAYLQSPLEPTAWMALLAAFGIQLLRWATRVAGGPTMPESTAEPVVGSASSRGEIAKEALFPQAVISATRVPDVEPAVCEPVIPVNGPGNQIVAGPEEAAAPAAPQSPDPRSIEVSSPVASQPAENPHEETAPSLRVFTTFLILRGPWRPVADIVIAALRRAGQRDAVLLRTETSSRQVAVQAGAKRLEITAEEGPIATWALEPALENFGEFPDGGESIRDHPSHVRLATETLPDVPPPEIVLLHHRAHAALAEFAPVEASLWPDASILAAAGGLSSLARDAANRSVPITSCVSIRQCIDDATGESAVLLDTLGLHALGLPDLEWIVPALDVESSVECLAALAEKLFVGDWVAADGPAQGLCDGSRWNVELREARRQPPRYVARIERVRVEESPFGGQ